MCLLSYFQVHFLHVALFLALITFLPFGHKLIFFIFFIRLGLNYSVKKYHQFPNQHNRKACHGELTDLYVDLTLYCFIAL